MRLLDDTPLDPQIAAALEAIDATLAGEPVDPTHAGIAELALLLRDERPSPSVEFSRRLDQSVARRFAPAQPAGEGKQGRPRRWWLWTPAAGLAAAVVIAIVIVVGGGSRPVSQSSSVNGGAVASAPAARVPHTSAKSAEPGTLAQTGRPAAATTTAQSSASTASGAVVAPVPNGRKIVQGAQLSLTTDPSRIEDVAQEVFVVVGQVHGIVSTSTVTASGAPDAYAQFQLSIPSGSLPQAMAALSSLRYARVASRTDTTQDVNDQYQYDVTKLADDRALRASLLKRLAAATTQGQIDSLTIRLHDIDAAISTDRSNLAVLDNQVNYSQVTVTVNGGAPPIPVRTSSGGGFGLHQAAHDAGRVLTVAAGVVLIGLAALVPVALVVALGWWIAAAIRRRRRQQALDMV